MFRPVPLPSAIHPILIFRTGSLGDSICALPAIDVIRRNFPNASIDILTNAGRDSYVSLAGVLRNDVAREIIDYLHTPWRELFRLLKAKQYDLFIELPQYDAPSLRQARNMLVVKALGISHAFGWRLASTLLFHGIQERCLEFSNDTDRLLAILADSGLTTSPADYIHSLTPDIIHAAESRPAVADLLQLPLIGLGIGGNEERKFWESEKYAHIARHFFDQGFTCLIFGGPGDYERGEIIQKACPDMVNLCGELSPLESMALIRTCRLVISNDTGTLHMAYAMDVPVIGIYTARDYAGKWYPPASRPHAVFRTSDIPCAICLRRGRNLPCEDNVCIQKIAPEAVIAAAERLLLVPPSVTIRAQ